MDLSWENISHLHPATITLESFGTDFPGLDDDFIATVKSIMLFYKLHFHLLNAQINFNKQHSFIETKEWVKIIHFCIHADC